MSVRALLRLAVLLSGLLLPACGSRVSGSDSVSGAPAGLTPNEGDGALSQGEWESVVLEPETSDDLGIRLLVERYDD